MRAGGGDLGNSFFRYAPARLAVYNFIIMYCFADRLRNRRVVKSAVTQSAELWELVGKRIGGGSTVTDLRTLGACGALLALIAAGPVRASECPGKSDALGTSRTLVVDPSEHIRLGMMQYPETLPLADHEVVLTFDDGPVARSRRTQRSKAGYQRSLPRLATATP